MYQNFWDVAKVMFRGKLKALNAHLRSKDRSQVNNLTLYL